MYDPELRRELRASLLEVCQSMRSQKRAVDLVSGEFKHCSYESKKTIEATHRTLRRLNLSEARR